MSYDTAKYANLTKGLKRGIFGGGYVDNTDQLSLGACYSPYARNFRLDGQSVVIRPGHQKIKDLLAGSNPKGIGSYLRADPANNVLVIRHNISGTQKLYTLTEGGTLTAITTSSLIASDEKMRFVNVADVIYCMNGVDHYGKLNATTYSHPTTGISNFAPKFAVTFSGKMVASGRSTNPNKVYFSKPDDYEDFNGSGAIQATFSEQLTGLCSTGQALFYFTPNTVSVTDFGDIVNAGGTATYNSTSLQVKEGALNHDSIVGVGNNVYYITNALSIKKLQRGANNIGFETIDLSDRPYTGITKLMQYIDKDQPDCFGRFYPTDNLIKWWFRGPGSTFNDICIIYDLTTDSFLVDTNKFFYDGVYFQGLNYTISQLEPKVYQDEYSYDDEGSPIPFEYRTKQHYVSGQFKNTLRESRTLVDINELAVLTQTICIDGREVDVKTIDKDNIPITAGGIGTTMIGTSTIGVEGPSSKELGFDYDMFEVELLRTKGNLNKKGNTIQYKYECGQVGAKVRLKTVMPRLETLPPIATPLTE